jgi:WD40 repeat protein
MSAARIFSSTILLLSAISFAQQPGLVLPIGHTSVLGSITFSPDGKKIITTSFDKTAKIWDAKTSYLLANLKSTDIYDNERRISREAFTDDLKPTAVLSEDGTKAATIFNDSDDKGGEVDVWDAKTGKLIKKITVNYYGESIVFSHAFFDHKGNNILICSKKENESWLYNLKRSYFSDTLIFPAYTGSAVFSPDDNNILLKYPKNISVFNIPSKNYVADIPATDLAFFVNDGKKIFSFSTRYSWPYDLPKLWNTGNGTLIKVLDSSKIRDVHSCINNGNQILISYEPALIKLWNMETMKEVFQIKLPSVYKSQEIKAYLSRDGKTLLYYGLDSSLRVIETGSGNVKYEIPYPPGDKIEAAALSPDGRMAVFGLSDQNIWEWDFSRKKLFPKLAGHVLYSGLLKYDKDPISISTISDDSLMHIWNLETGRFTVRQLGNPGKIYEVIYSPDGQQMAIRCNDEIARIFNVYTGEHLYDLVGHTNFISSLVYSPDGKEILTASYDSTLRIWSAADGNPVRVIAKLSNEPEIAVYSKDMKSIEIKYYYSSTNVTVLDLKTNEFSQKEQLDTIVDPTAETYLLQEEKNELNLYKKQNQELAFTLTGHKSDINQVRYSPDGKLIITSSDDNNAIIWDKATGKAKWILSGHSSFVKDAQFSPDGKYVITCSRDNTLKKWDTRTGKLIVTFFPVDSKYFFDQIPAGYYYATPEAAKLLHYVTKDLKVITFEQLDVKYNRPDKVLEAIGNTDTALIKSYQKAWEKRIKKLGIDTTAFRDGYSVPEADFANRNNIDYEQKNESLTLHIKGIDSTYKLDRFNVWVNEAPVYGQKGVSISKRNKNSLGTTITIKLSQGENRIETSVTNVNGTESYRMPLIVNYTPAVKQKEITHFIGIGIDQFADKQYNLQYSSKDIRDLSKKLKEKYGDAIIIDTLFNQNVTVANVKALKQKLKQTTENDKVIIAYSGHGMLSKDYDYYLSTYSINFEKPEQNGLPYDELESLLDSIPARKKLMLIDACHSGEVDKEELTTINSTADSMKLKKGIKPVAYKQDEKHLGLKNSFELMQSLFVNVGKSTGATIISAAAGTQFALERGDLKNGVFTYSILEAMNKYPTLKISELKKIVGERVEQLTNGLQKPTSRNETIAVDWGVW